MKVVAVDDIAAGTEITTSYLEPFLTTNQRRERLRVGKCFACDCKRWSTEGDTAWRNTEILFSFLRRCSDPTEFGSHSSSVRCPGCQSYLAPSDPLGRGSPWQCISCDVTVEGGRICAMEESLSRQVGAAEEAMDVRLLEEIGEGLGQHLHQTHAIMCKIKQALCEGTYFSIPCSSCICKICNFLVIPCGNFTKSNRARKRKYTER